VKCQGSHRVWVFLKRLRNATEHALTKAAKLQEPQDKEDALELCIQALELDLQAVSASIQVIPAAPIVVNMSHKEEVPDSPFCAWKMIIQ
jgi:hypothetical protein